MTTDITELAQSLKAAAERVIKNYDSEWFETGSQICTVHKSKINLISLANPVNVLALVEALESKERTIQVLESSYNDQTEALEKAQTERDEFRRRFNLERSILEDADKDLETLRQRIAELESHTVKLPSTRLWAGVTECYEKADVIAAIRAAGMEVSDD